MMLIDKRKMMNYLCEKRFELLVEKELEGYLNFKKQKQLKYIDHQIDMFYLKKKLLHFWKHLI